MAAPRDTIFNVAEPALLLRQLTVAQDDHRRIVAALEAGQARRASVASMPIAAARTSGAISRMSTCGP